MENRRNVAPAVAVPSAGAASINLSDEKLFALCRQYGRNALEWRRKFLGLLPEVAKRKLYEKHGFSSIFEFGFKLAGVSELQIRRTLNMEEKFRDKKILHRMLVNGEVSVNKLYKIAPIATIENQKILAEQIKILPCGALETLARDEKNLVKSNLQNDHVVVSTDQIGLFGKSEVDYEIKLSEEVKQRLSELQKKGININELLMEFLNKREKEIKEEKEKIAQEMLARKTGEQSNVEFAEAMAKRLAKSISEAIGDDTIVEPLVIVAENSRHVPASVKKIVQKEFGTKCAVPTCSKLAEHLHHTLPFALSQNHDPRYLMPLCKEHHVIAHSIDQKFHKVRQTVT